MISSKLVDQMSVKSVGIHHSVSVLTIIRLKQMYLWVV